MYLRASHTNELLFGEKGGKGLWIATGIAFPWLGQIYFHIKGCDTCFPAPFFFSLRQWGFPCHVATASCSGYWDCVQAWAGAAESDRTGCSSTEGVS